MLVKLSEILSNPFYSFLLATFVGIISNFLTGILIGKFFDRTKRLWWGVNNEWLNQHYFAKTSKLRVTYVGLDNKRKEIKSTLSVLRFVFWSNGKDTLSNDDISSKEPLIIALESDIELLEVRQITSSNSTIQIKPISNNSLLIDFDYLQPNQGAVFDMIVSGFSESAKLTGVLKNGKILTKKLYLPAFMALPFFPKKWSNHTRISASKWILTSIFIVSLWVLFLQKLDINGIIFLIALIAIPYLFILYPFWTTPLIPKELNEFYDENITI